MCARDSRIAGATQRPEQRRVDEAAGHARPRATRPRPPPAAAAPAGTQARGSAFRRERSLLAVKARQPALDLGEQRRHVDVRRRRRARPGQPCPSSRSGRRARTPSVPAWSAGGRVLAGRRRGLGSHVGAVGLLQVRDLTGTGLRRHRWQRRVALCARRGRVARRSAATDELPHCPRRCGRGQRPTCLRAHPATLEPPGFVGHRARPNHRCGELLAGVTTYGPEQRARIKTVRAEPRLFVSQQFSAKPWATRQESWEKSDDDHAASKRHRQ